MRMIAAFEKSDQVRFIGHLDLMRVVQRALRRSGLPICYSKGFNPHVMLSFAAPLAVGVSGLEELMDVAIDGLISETYFMKKLGPAMPDSLPLCSARAVEDRHPKLMAELRTAAYTAALQDSDAARAMADAIPMLLARKEIQTIRVTKSGEKQADVRPMLHELSAERAGEGILLRFRVSLTELETLKPDLLLKVLAEQAGVCVPQARLTRTALYAEREGRPVRLMER